MPALNNMLQPNSKLQQGRYDIIRHLSSGGMGAVYKAKDNHLNIDVEIKVAQASQAELLEAFKREVDILARLNHVALPNVLDHFTESEHQYLVMNFIEGQDLDELLRGRGQAFSVEEVLQCSEQILNVLDYLRSQDVIHGDIQPKNLKWDGKNKVTLLNFGVAKRKEANQTHEASSSARDITSDYSSLEQHEGKNTDQQSDFYALGATLYHLMTNEKPDDALKRSRVIGLHKTDRLRSAHELVSQIPAHISDALKKMMELDRTKRPKDVAEIRKLLFPDSRRWVLKLTQSTLALFMTFLGFPLSEFLEPYRWVIALYLLGIWVVLTVIELRPIPMSRLRWAGFAIAVVVIGLFGMSFAGFLPGLIPTDASSGQTSNPVVLQGTPLPQDLAVISAENASELREIARWDKEEVNEVAYSSDSKLLAVAGLNGVYLYDVQAGKEIDFLSRDESINTIAFSADRRLLAAGSNNNSVQLWDVSDASNGKFLETLDGHADEVQSVSFSLDGTYLASGSEDNMVRLWHVKDRQLFHTFEGHTDEVTSVSFSPDGSYLASGSKDDTVRLWSVSDKEFLDYFGGHEYAVQSVSFTPDGSYLASGSRDDTVRLWRVSDGQLLHSFQLQEDTYLVTSVSFTPDGSVLASGGCTKLYEMSCLAGEVRLWRVSDGQLLHRLEHSDSVNSVSFSPDGRILASGWNYGTIRLWGVRE